MEGLESLTGIQHSEDEPQKRLRQLTSGKRPLQNVTLNVHIDISFGICWRHILMFNHHIPKSPGWCSPVCPCNHKPCMWEWAVTWPGPKWPSYWEWWGWWRGHHPLRWHPDHHGSSHVWSGGGRWLLRNAEKCQFQQKGFIILIYDFFLFCSLVPHWKAKCNVLRKFSQILLYGWLCWVSLLTSWLSLRCNFSVVLYSRPLVFSAAPKWPLFKATWGQLKTH